MVEASINEGLALLRQKGLVAFEQRYAEALKEKATLPNMRRVYATLEQSFDRFVPAVGIDPASAEAQIATFRDAWEKQQRSPFTSACLALLLFRTGCAYRGSGGAAAVSSEEWGKLEQYWEEAHDLFTGSAKAGLGSAFWHRALFKLSLADGSDKATQLQRFEAALAFDALDLDIYEALAARLTPRRGGSYLELDDLAREAMARTEYIHGAIFYACIYDHVADLMPLTESAADWPLLRRGYSEWLRRVDNQMAANRFAMLALHFDDEEMLRKIGVEHLRAYHPSTWNGVEAAANVLEWLAQQGAPGPVKAPTALRPAVALTAPAAAKRSGLAAGRPAAVGFGKRKPVGR